METRRLRRDRPEFAAVALVVLVVIVAGAAIGSRYVPGVTGSHATAGGASHTSTSDPHIVHWFVGLESETPDLLAAERAFTRKFNATNTDGTILEIEPSAETDGPAASLDLLKTLIADGDSPDIVGPVTPSVLHGLSGLAVDLNQAIASNHIDLSVYDHRLLTELQMPTADTVNAQIGLPYAVDPAFIFYNKDLFQKAGLSALPTKVGEKYMGKDWDWNELAAVAVRLTRDTSGRTAADPGFDSDHIDQFGIDFPGEDARTVASAFGSGSFLASDGTTIQIPSVWADGLSWYYNAMWTSHIAPSETYANGVAVTFSAATSISSGRLAMAVSSPSKIPTYMAGGKASFSSWGMAVLPSWHGVTTSPEEVSTFSILTTSTNQDRAFSAMLAIEANPELSAAVGGMPVDPSLRSAWLASQTQTQAALFPGSEIDWSVLDAMDSHAADPGSDSDLANYNQSVDDISSWFENLRSNSTVNMNTELAKLLTILGIDANDSRTQLNQ